MKCYYKKAGFYKNVSKIEKIEDICCDKFKSALNDDFITKGEFDCNLGLLSINKAYCYPECTCYDSVDIYFCPFCGEKISYFEVKKCK